MTPPPPPIPRHRNLNCMMNRILSCGRSSQDLTFIMPWSLWDCGETAETFEALFVNDEWFVSELQKHVRANYLFKKHVPLLICDGAALGHHAGTSGHSGLHGCNHCTCPAEFKHIDPADYVADKVLAGILGGPRTVAAAQAAMAEFEVALAAEMAKNKDKYVKKVGEDGFKEWAGIQGLGTLKHHPAHVCMPPAPRH